MAYAIHQLIDDRYTDDSIALKALGSQAEISKLELRPVADKQVRVAHDDYSLADYSELP